MTSYLRKCRICNEEIIVLSNSDFAKCSHCGEFHLVKWLPKLIHDKNKKTSLWNKWQKLEYSKEDVQRSLDIAKTEGEMGYPAIQDVLDRMEKNHMESINRFKLSGSELDCIEKAMYFIHSTETEVMQ